MNALAALDKDGNSLKNGNAADRQMYTIFEKDSADLEPLFKAYENKESRGRLRDILNDFTSDNVIWKHILKNFSQLPTAQGSRLVTDCFQSSHVAD